MTEQDAREQSMPIEASRRAQANDVMSCKDSAPQAPCSQAEESHQNVWSGRERPSRLIRNLLNATPIPGGRSRNGQRNYAYRQRQIKEGLVPVRLLLLREVHTAVTQLRDRHGFDNLSTAINAYLVIVERRVNIAALAMPRRHSTAEPYVECNAMVSEQARAFLDRIKSTHGLSRYYALEALLVAHPDPWAVRPGANNSYINSENAVSG